MIGRFVFLLFLVINFFLSASAIAVSAFDTSCERSIGKSAILSNH